MVSVSHLEDDGEDTLDPEELIQSDSDPQIKHLITLWDTRFEQHEPPIEDKITQVNLRDEANPKPIFISESLSPFEKEDLIYLIQEYIDVFTWNYEDMPMLDPQIVMHRLNINSDAKLVKQHVLDPTLWKQSKPKFINSSNAASFEKNNTQTGLLILSLCSIKMKKNQNLHWLPWSQRSLS